MSRALLTVVLALVLAAPAQAAPFSNAGYWAFADDVMRQLDGWWDPGRQAYVLRGVPSTRVNSAMLLAHSVAARMGHDGPTRQDARARVLVRRMTEPPAWLGATLPGGLTTCWSRDVDRVKRQHASLEPKVAEALAWAWRARAELGLEPRDAEAIERTVETCARSAAWRDVRVANQINWNAEMYASAAVVTGRADQLRHAYRRQLAGFAGDPANLGAGYQFHYWPHRSAGAGTNLDSPEYANIVAHALGHHGEARRQGMRALPAASVRRLRGWVTRLLAGSWTHAGYLNWDTGKGRRRWHSAQYWAFAQQGLLAIATSPEFWERPSYGPWAKAMFDRGLELFGRRADANGGLPPKHMFGVHTRMEEYDCFCARMLANAVRAVALDLGSQRFEDPPPLYAFDSDTGRLAVTTPRYSTAIVPDNRGAFAYGGIDPARLFGAGQTVAANVGGTPPAAFGVVIPGVLASQHTRAGRLRLGRAPRARPGGPRAGPFGTLIAHGAVSRGRIRMTASHRFRAASIASRWSVTGTRRRAFAHFPSWGARAVIEAELRDGSRVVIAPGSRVRLSDVSAFTLSSGYRVVPLVRPRGATVTAVAVRRQATNPHPGPSLRIAFRGSLAVRIVPG